jgi:hypothetical protein
MKSEATTVKGYLADVPEERRPALEDLRRMCLEELVGYEEDVRYGMPSYSRDGAVEVAFASQRNYISLYVLRESVVKANAPPGRPLHGQRLHPLQAPGAVGPRGRPPPAGRFRRRHRPDPLGSGPACPYCTPLVSGTLAGAASRCNHPGRQFVNASVPLPYGRGH